nr:hypothetical protein BaRGS_028868 [Batillaria attramentaria]
MVMGSSTMVKKIPIPKRHQDTFGGYEYNFTGQRGVMLHTDRYQFEALRSFEGLNQRDRLLAEMEYLEQLRSIKRRRELMPHRAKLDLFMGGKKIEFEERFDINREIQKLKAMAMPQRARDLYHGKGIILPPHLRYEQLKSQLPKEFSEHHEDFVKKVYELTSSSGSFFGVSEFLMMTQLTNRVASLSSQRFEPIHEIG